MITAGIPRGQGEGVWEGVNEEMIQIRNLEMGVQVGVDTWGGLPSQQCWRYRVNEEGSVQIMERGSTQF